MRAVPALLLLAAALPSGLSVQGAWTRASLPGGNSAVIYFDVTDTGPPDQLVSARTGIAAAASLHETSLADGVSRMRAVAKAPVSVTAPLRLAPGGLHLMLTGLRHRLVAGEIFTVTLIFAHAGQIDVPVTVMPATTTGTMAGMKMD